jgi:putative nucleotidyltransferase with HDIG domain
MVTKENIMIDILFVDDEPNILDGLQRMLHSLRREWQLSFATSGVEALTLLQSRSFDVIVSDMRMPGMDGAQLLQEVRNHYPHIIRIILSGYSEKELIMKSVGAAHQYLAKPCDAETLKSTISLAYARRNLLADEKLRRFVSQLPAVPSLPTLYRELLEELNKPDSSLKKIREIIKRDIGMTAKILQMVNSAFFGLRRNISDVSEAVNLLGLDTISSLTLAIGIFSQFNVQSAYANAVTELWEHSSMVGATAKSIAAQECSAVATDAFTAGLLHDVGRVVLAINLPQQFARVKELMAHEHLSMLEAEKQIFSATHAEVGAYLLGLWGLPNAVVEAVAFHHLPGACSINSFSALTAVHLADAIMQAKTEPATRPQQFFDVEFLTHLNLLEKLPIWQQQGAQFRFSTAANL